MYKIIENKKAGYTQLKKPFNAIWEDCLCMQVC